MKFYSSIQQVSVSIDAVKSAWAFAKKVSFTTDYSDSNQKKFLKIRDDHFVSKLGEEACKIVLNEFADVAGPDYKIYYGKEKSWEEDLFINGIGLAVKTQRRTNAQKYSLSWVFQAGNERRDIILNKPEAWVVFVEYDDTPPCNYRCNVYPPFQIKELQFEEPKLEHLKASKKVVYARSLNIAQ